MPNNAAEKNLADKRYLTLILRLSVDRQGKLKGGIVVDLSGQRVGKFRQVEELPTWLTHWLKAWVHGQDSTDPDHLA